MKTPYEILGVSAAATDIEIKQAYLREVKSSPPDRDQERFQLIHDAYSSIKDNKSRMSYALFTIPGADFDELLDRSLDTTHTVRIKPEQFSKLLHAGIDDATFLNAMANPEKS